MFATQRQRFGQRLPPHGQRLTRNGEHQIEVHVLKPRLAQDVRYPAPALRPASPATRPAFDAEWRTSDRGSLSQPPPGPEFSFPSASASASVSRHTASV